MGIIATGAGYWGVWWWIFFFALSLGGVLYFRSLGRSDYKKGTEQDEIFNCGHDIPEDGEEIKVPASSIYWGFTKALSGYYKLLVGMHTGILTDYVGIFLIATAIIAVAILLT